MSETHEPATTKMAESDTLLVRIRAYNDRQGHVLRRYTYKGYKFQGERGWYRVPREVGEYLRTVRHVASDSYSPFAFDVCTNAEAAELDAREQAELTTRKGPANAIDVTGGSEGAVTTADLPDGDAPRRGRGRPRKNPV